MSVAKCETAALSWRSQLRERPTTESPQSYPESTTLVSFFVTYFIYSACQIQWNIYHIFLFFIFQLRESYCEVGLLFSSVALKTCRCHISACLTFNRNYLHFILQKKIYFVILCRRIIMNVIFKICMKLLQAIVFCKSTFELKIRIQDNLFILNLSCAFC